MKAAIVTLISENFGNRLQNYAVQHVFEEKGFEVETLNNPFDERYNPFIQSIKDIIKNHFFYKKYEAQILRKKSFNDFEKKYIHYAKWWLNSKKHIIKLNDKYEYFICGSDQIWNPTSYRITAKNFLFFAERKKRIPLAPSFGVCDVPDERKNEFKDYLNGFDQLSIREKSGANIIKMLTGKEAEVLIDPTMMLSCNEWKKLSQRPRWFNEEKYILNYTLGEQYEKDKIEDLGTKYGLKVINLMDQSDKDIYSINPSNFLYLIQNCELVITDSFHGTVFSVLFDKPVIVMERKDYFVAMNTRLDNLLDLLKLGSRKFDTVFENGNFFEHEYFELYKIIELERSRVHSFINKVIQ